MGKFYGFSWVFPYQNITPQRFWKPIGKKSCRHICEEYGKGLESLAPKIVWLKTRSDSVAQMETNDWVIPLKKITVHGRVAIHMWLGLSHPLADDIHPSEPFDPPLLVKSPRTVGVRFPILASSPNMEKYWHMFATDMWCFPEIGGYPQFPSILFRCSRISQPFLGSPHLWKPYDTSMCISV